MSVSLVLVQDLLGLLVHVCAHWGQDETRSWMMTAMIEGMTEYLIEFSLCGYALLN
jgi:hypothetical protein